MAKNPLQVTIINDPLRKADCDGACGADWSSMQTLDMARKQIHERFGENARLTYIDVAEGTMTDSLQSWLDYIKERKLSVPLLVIDGQVRISGHFDVRQMMDAIEVQTEMGV